MLFDEDLWCIKTMLGASVSMRKIEKDIVDKRERIKLQMMRKKRRDEMEMARMPAEKRKMIETRRMYRHLRDTQNPFLMPEHTFVHNYRLTPHLAHFLIAELTPFMPMVKLKFGISTEAKILMALHFFAHGTNQRSLTNSGFSQRSCSRSIKEVVEALNSCDIVDKWIRFPVNHVERQHCTANNLSELQLPGVVGMVDATHVAITPPAKREGSREYTCYNNVTALNVQIVCDAYRKIVDVKADCPGSYPNAYVWHISQVRKKMEAIYRGGEICWLVGGWEYPLEPWLLTPLAPSEQYPPGARYNMLLAGAHTVTRRCITSLKNRFRCIRRRALDYSPVKSARIVVACAVLHNMCRNANLASPESSDVEPDVETSDASRVSELRHSAQSDYMLRQEGMHNIDRIARHVALPPPLLS